MPDGFTFSNGIQLASLLIAGLSALLTVWWRIEVRIRGVEDRDAKERAKIEREMQDYKLHVAENYASWETVKEIEKSVRDLPDVVVKRILEFMSLKNQNS